MEMLRVVFDCFINEDELLIFIQEIEVDCGEKIYMKKWKIFGEDFMIFVIFGYIIFNIVKLLKYVRNVIVYLSD